MAFTGAYSLNIKSCVYTHNMTIADSPTAHRPRPMRTALRWLCVLLLSALLHLLVISWLRGVLYFPSSPTTNETNMITATLEAPPPKAVIKTALKPRPHKPPARPAAPRVASAPQAALASSETALAEIPLDDFDHIESVALTEAALAEISATEDETSGAQYNIDLPPSVDLKYAVQKTPKEGAPMYGSGTISWQTNGDTYRVTGEFGVLFITALRFQSSGTIEDTGIVPELYSEKRFRKAETNTHFHRERNTINFSASTQSYPRNGGEQDRASIIWQLAGIGRGDSEKFVAGSNIALVVAGTRNAETWQILIIGQEELVIDGNNIHAWHVARAPRSGSHDQKLDIWLAPEKNWYPVRLRYTENNGDYLDMTLTGLNVSAVP